MMCLKQKYLICLTMFSFFAGLQGVQAEDTYVGLGYGGALEICPNTVEKYQVLTSFVVCSTHPDDIEVTITPIDEFGNPVEVSFPVGEVVDKFASGVVQIDGITYGKVFDVDIVFTNPPNHAYSRVKVCVTIRCAFSNNPTQGIREYTDCSIREIQTSAATPISLQGGGDISCCDEGPFTFCTSRTDNSGGSEYKWFIPAGWTVVGADDEECITVMPPADRSVSGADVFQVWPVICGDANATGFGQSLTLDPVACDNPDLKPEIEIIQEIPCASVFGGQLQATPLHGNGPYTFEWLRNGSPIAGNNNIAINLDPGDYEVIVADKDGCEHRSDPITLSDPANDVPLAVTLAVSELSPAPPLTVEEVENGICWHHIVATPSGGVAPYTFEWQGNPHFNTPHFNIKGVALVNVVVTDARGCTVQASVTTPLCGQATGSGGSGTTKRGAAPEAGQSADLRISLLPNPATSTVTIDYRLEAASYVEVKIFNSLGELAALVDSGPKAAGEQRSSCDLSGLAPGSYLVQIISRTGTYSAQLNVSP